MLTKPMLKSACLLFALSLFMVLINIDYTAVNLALVTLSQDLHCGLNTVQWVLSGYALAWAAIIIPAGKLADIIGRKRMAIIGLSLFIAGSLLAGLVNTIHLVIAGRLLQGMAGAIFIPTLYSLIHASFHKSQLGIALGFISLGIGLGMALGPTFGGIILTYWGWRWIFIINVPLCLLILAALTWSAQEVIATPNDKLDYLSASLLSLFLIVLIYTLSQIHSLTLAGPHYLILCFTAIIILYLFIWRQTKSEYPLIPFELLKNRIFVGTTLTLAIEQFGFTTIIVALALFFQRVLGYSVLSSSLLFLALSLMTGIISPFGGYVVAKFGFKKPALFGIACVALGSFWLTRLSLDPSLIWLILPLAIIGIGMGVALTSLQTGIVTTVPESQVGVASGVFVMLALIGNTIGVLVTALVFQSNSTTALVNHLQTTTSSLSPLQVTALNQLIAYTGVTPTIAEFPIAVQTKITQFLPYALQQGFNCTLFVNAIMMLIALFLCACMVKETAQAH